MTYRLPIPILPVPSQSIPEPQPQGSCHESQFSVQQLDSSTSSKGKSKARGKPKPEDDRFRPYTVQEKKAKKKKSKKGEAKKAKEAPKGVRLPDLPELAVRIEGALHFELNAHDHPSLYYSQRGSLHNTETTKFVPVKAYPPTFTRRPHYAPLPPNDFNSEDASASANPTRGRPRDEVAWQIQKEDAACSCGRWLGADKSLRDHLQYYEGKADPFQVTCKAHYIQRETKSNQCIFCDAVIGRDKDAVERHFWGCKPLKELKSLIRESHLKDHGLQSCEIKSFRWPVVPRQH
jgi:hypothetical protein